MNRDSWIFLCWSYVLGLLSTGVFYFDYLKLSNFNQVLFILLLSISSSIISLVLLRSKYFNIKKSVYFLMIGIFVFAPIYFHLRLPTPQKTDISHELEKSIPQEIVTVSGKVISEPRINANGNIKFWFKVNNLQKTDTISSSVKKVSGKLYVTAPLLKAKNIHSQESLKVQGFIYAPKNPQNPGQFNFKKYLWNYGCFAGFKAINVFPKETIQKTIWGWWKVRKRIIRAQVRGLGSPIGQLVSSMVLGRRAVDLPHDIRDLFIKTGLAHILAASGFHVSLLLGMILRLTSSLEPKRKLWIGLITLFFYSFLTGFSPSVIRAVLMGIAALLAICIGGKVKPLGSLFLSIIVILIVNPVWIWNLGLQLSFLATLGLIVSVPNLEKKLDWMPPLLATTISVPIAASIWTLPLIIFTFNTISSYSILVNAVSMPLVTIISLGGMIASCISLIIPVIGSFLASFLYYPCLLLIGIVRFFSDLPGSNIFVGKISLLVLFVIYGLICFIWLAPKYKKIWILLFVVIIALISLPIIYNNFTLFQITILSANQQPIIIIQDKGKTTLINSGKTHNIIKYSILPFLKTVGINSIDYGIALNNKYNSSQNWSYLQEQVTVENLVQRDVKEVSWKDKVLKIESTEININWLFLPEDNTNKYPLINIRTDNYSWIIIDDLNQNNIDYIKQQKLDSLPLVLVWSGNKLESKWLDVLEGNSAIANHPVMIAITAKFQDREIKTKNSSLDLAHIIERDGAITWNPKFGFQDTFRNREYNYN